LGIKGSQTENLEWLSSLVWRGYATVLKGMSGGYVRKGRKGRWETQRSENAAQAEAGLATIQPSGSMLLLLLVLTGYQKVLFAPRRQ